MYLNYGRLYLEIKDFSCLARELKQIGGCVSFYEAEKCDERDYP